MQKATEQAIKRLLELEVQAEQMRDECHKTRMLLEASVSTPAEESIERKLRVAGLGSDRKKFLQKKTQQVTTAGHSQQ